MLNHVKSWVFAEKAQLSPTSSTSPTSPKQPAASTTSVASAGSQAPAPPRESISFKFVLLLMYSIGPHGTRPTRTWAQGYSSYIGLFLSVRIHVYDCCK